MPKDLGKSDKLKGNGMTICPPGAAEAATAIDFHCA